jgi:cellulose biosynthesis protein BcsQ
VSRFFDAVRRADESRQRPHPHEPPPPDAPERRSERPFRVLAVAGNKGGVGKTTVATNLAVYLRAMREDLPILLIGLDDQPQIDRMFAIEPGASGGARPTIEDALRGRSLAAAIRVGNYGVHYVPTSSGICGLKREFSDRSHLEGALRGARWQGLVIVDTKSDLEILTQNALAASDLALVLARDLPSLGEAQKVFDLLVGWRRPRESARILLSLIDLRIRYSHGETRDVLSLLLAEIRRLGLPLFETFLSSSPKVESLQTNPARVAQTILHGAPGSIVHRQMQHLADEVLRVLYPPAVEARAGEPAAAPGAAERGEPAPEPADPPSPRPHDVDVEAWLARGRAETRG